jgi:MFS family permease
MAIQIADEFAFGAALLGLAIGIARGSAAVGSVLFGRVVDRIGAVRALRLAMAIAAVTCFGMFETTVGPVSLMVWLAAASWANALGQPAANRLLANVVSPTRLGTAFGLKQSAPPVASMLAGLCVPTLAVTLGWRWGYLMVAVMAIVVAFAVGRRPPARPRREPLPAGVPFRSRNIVMFAIAFGSGTAASSTATAFFVTSAVGSGTSPDVAGLLLAAGSIAAVVTRVTAGLASDRMRTGHLKLCALMLAVGSLGFVLLALGRSETLALGIVITLAGAWGFNGVFWFSMVRAFPANPGAITGVLSPGGYFGAAAGPIAFGLLAEHAGYSWAWAAGGVMAVVATLAMMLGARRLSEHGLA